MAHRMIIESGYSQSCGGKDGAVGVKPPENTVGIRTDRGPRRRSCVGGEMGTASWGPTKAAMRNTQAFLPLIQ